MPVVKKQRYVLHGKDIGWQDNMGIFYDDGRAKGKRVKANFPLTQHERATYISLKGNAAKMTRFLMDTRKLELAPAWELMKLALRS